MNRKMTKIIFISSSTDSPRVYKRIDEFVEQGYQVDLYAFQRKTFHTHITNASFKYKVNIIGTIPNAHYFRRLFSMYKSLKNLFTSYQEKDVCYYYFMLDVALVSLLLNKKKKYIYEESDLVHTYISNKLLKWGLRKLDKFIIHSSIQTVLTSEGFAQYHFGNNIPSHVSIIPNKLNKKIKNISILPKSEFDPKKLKISFIGFPRYDTIAYFGTIVASKFPQYEFHIYGNISADMENKFEHLKHFSNVFFHGVFSTPDDLPLIYSKTDLVLSTYDVRIENVKYAEPNKLYESIFFETPIIVSKNTFLAKKVLQLNVGYEVDPLNEDDIVKLIRNLTLDSLNDKILSCQQHNKEDLLNNNTMFFNKIRQLIPAL